MTDEDVTLSVLLLPGDAARAETSVESARAAGFEVTDLDSPIEGPFEDLTGGDPIVEVGMLWIRHRDRKLEALFYRGCGPAERDAIAEAAIRLTTPAGLLRRAWETDPCGCRSLILSMRVDDLSDESTLDISLPADIADLVGLGFREEVRA